MMIWMLLAHLVLNSDPCSEAGLSGKDHHQSFRIESIIYVETRNLQAEEYDPGDREGEEDEGENEGSEDIAHTALACCSSQRDDSARTLRWNIREMERRGYWQAG